MSHDVGTVEQQDFESRARAVGSALATSLGAVVDALPNPTSRPAPLVAALGVNRDIAGRTLATIRAADPLVALHGAPGPEPLRKFIRAAAQHDVPTGVLDAAEQAIARFESLIRNEAGDRRALDAIICDRTPALRDKYEQSARHGIFRGVSELKGVQADLNLTTAILTPAADGTMLDAVWVIGLLGTCRLRPNVPVKMGARRMVLDADDDSSVQSLSDVNLDQYCVNTPARLASHRTDDVMIYTLDEQSVGRRAVVDLLAAHRHAGILERYRASTPRHMESVFADIAVPVRAVVLDVFMHPDVFPGAEPTVVMHDTGVDGLAHINDPRRDFDQMPVREPVEVLGTGIARAHCDELPTYPDLLQRVASANDWDINTYRGYRIRMSYPMYGSQIHMAFQPPLRD